MASAIPKAEFWLFPPRSPVAAALKQPSASTYDIHCEDSPERMHWLDSVPAPARTRPRFSAASTASGRSPGCSYQLGAAALAHRGTVSAGSHANGPAAPQE